MGGSPYHQKWSAYTIRMKRSRLLALVIVVALPAIAQNQPGEKSPISHSPNRWITTSAREPYDPCSCISIRKRKQGRSIPADRFAPDNTLKIDMASNLAVAYRQRGDDDNAQKWLDNAIAWTSANRRK